MIDDFIVGRKFQVEPIPRELIVKYFYIILIISMLVLTCHSKVSAQVEFEIPMTEGWNMISSPVNPENRDMWIIFSNLRDIDNLIMAKDGIGHFLVPEFNFVNVPDWVFAQGYQVKLSGADTLTIIGEQVDPETSIRLIRGWSMIAYFPEEQVDAITALSNIEEHLIIAKDGFGRFYNTEFNFSNMADLRQGRGYLVKVREATDLVWNRD